MRTQLARPNNGVLGPNTYDQLFTMHGITMIFWFIIPMTTGAFGNYLIPLMLGARDMAFPRLNALSFWVFLASGHLPVRRPLPRLRRRTPAGSTTCRSRRSSTTPAATSSSTRSGCSSTALASTLTAANFIVTIFKCRAPGMSFNRIPLFCFAFLAASFGLLFALPSRQRRPDLPLPRPQRRHPLLRPGARRLDAALAAPLLVLRSSGGLHPDRARVRHRDRDHPRVHATEDDRVPARRDRRAPRRLHRLRRLGAPHVRRRDPDRRRSSSSRAPPRWS